MRNPAENLFALARDAQSLPAYAGRDIDFITSDLRAVLSSQSFDENGPIANKNIEALSRDFAMLPGYAGRDAEFVKQDLAGLMGKFPTGTGLPKYGVAQPEMLAPGTSNIMEPQAPAAAPLAPAPAPLAPVAPITLPEVPVPLTPEIAGFTPKFSTAPASTTFTPTMALVALPENAPARVLGATMQTPEQAALASTLSNEIKSGRRIPTNDNGVQALAGEFLHSITYGAPDALSEERLKAFPAATVTGQMAGIIGPVLAGGVGVAKAMTAIPAMVKLAGSGAKLKSGVTLGRVAYNAIAQMTAQAADYSIRNKDALLSEDPKIRNQALAGLAVNTAAIGASSAPAALLKPGWFQPIIGALVDGIINIGATKVLGQDPFSPEVLPYTLANIVAGGLFRVPDMIPGKPAPAPDAPPLVKGEPVGQSLAAEDAIAQVRNQYTDQITADQNAQLLVLEKELKNNRTNRRAALQQGIEGTPQKDWTQLPLYQSIQAKYGETRPTKAQVVTDFGLSRSAAGKALLDIYGEPGTQASAPMPPTPDALATKQPEPAPDALALKQPTAPDALPQGTEGAPAADASIPKGTVPYSAEFNGIKISGSKDFLSGLPDNSTTKNYIANQLPEDHWTMGFDGDKFKAVNDVFGHAEGDKVLAEIGRLAQKHFPDRFIGREGGEEFFGDFGKDLTSADIERVKAFHSDVAENIKLPDGSPFTLSIGLGKGKEADAKGQLRLRSDIAAYEAKNRGRNQIYIDNGPNTEYTSIVGPDVGKKAYLTEFSKKQVVENVELLVQQGDIDAGTASRILGEIRGSQTKQEGGRRNIPPGTSKAAGAPDQVISAKAPAEPVAKQTTAEPEAGTSSNAAVGPFTDRPLPAEPPASPKDATAPEPTTAPDGTAVHPIELPEGVEIAKGLAKGQYPLIKAKLRAAKGMARGVAKGRNIELKADIFKDPIQAAKILFHEIGHVIDFIPDTLKRGNILGHLGALKGHMKKFMAGADGPKAYNDPEIRKELIAISKAHRGGFDENGKTPYDQYRKKPAELYADAFSVLATDPALLKSTGPKFWNGFFEFLDKRPEAKDAWNKIQARSAKGPDAIFKDRERRLTEGYEVKEAQRKQKLVDEIAAEKEKKTTAGQSAYTSLVEKGSIIERAVAAAKKAGKAIPDAVNPFFRFAAQKYLSGRQHVYINESLRAEAKAKIKGDKFWNDGQVRKYVGLYLQLKRGSGELAEKAGPEGVQGKFAEEQLEYLKKSLGPEKAQKIEEAANAYWDVRGKEVVPFLTEGAYADTFSPELTKKLKENREYSRREVVKDFIDQYGKNAAGSLLNMKGVVGTTKAIGNPLVETVAYDVGLMQAKQQSDLIRSTVEFFEQHQGDKSIVGHVKVSPAETYGTEKGLRFKHVDDKDTKTVYFLKNGKLQGYNISAEIATLLKNEPTRPDWVLRGLRAVGDIQRSVFVKYSIPFLLRNPIRDVMGSVKNIHEYGAITGLPRALQYTFKAIPEVWRYIKTGEMSPDIKAAFKEGAMPVSRNFEKESKLQGTDEIERMLATFEGQPEAYNTWAGRALSKVDKFFEAWGQLEEKTRKLADYKFIKENTNKSSEARAQQIRKQSGTPDVFAGGTTKPVSNQLFIFSNVNMQGHRAAIQALREDPTRYLSKLAIYDLAPKAFMLTAAAGAEEWLSEQFGFGKEEAKWFTGAYSAIPDDDKARYFCMPIPMKTESGKQAYLRLPSDYTGQLISSMSWKAMNAGRPDGVKDLAKLAVSVSPFGTASLQPVAELASGVAQYATKGNIYDSYTGKPVIPKERQGTDFKHEAPYIGKWAYDQIGGSIVYRIPDDFDFRKKGAWEEALGLPVVGPSLGAFIKISDRGISERYRDAGLKVQKKEKIEAADLKDKILNRLEERGAEDRSSARAFFNQLQKEGFYKKGSGKGFGEFWSRYKELGVKKLGSPEQKALQNATSKAEQEAIAEEILRPMNLSKERPPVKDGVQGKSEYEIEKMKLLRIRRLFYELLSQTPSTEE